MKVDRLYEELMGDLRVALKKARKHKANTCSCVRFMMNMEEEIDELVTTILDGSYALRPSVCFVVSNPVLREVIAADFRDRIVHHYIFDYLNPQLERELIEDCYSCREGKGTGYGVDRLEHHILSCSQNYTREAWCLQLDISGYFMHIDRQKLYQMTMELMGRIGERRDGYGRKLKSLPKHQLIEQLLAKVILYDPMQNCEVRDRRKLYPLLPHSKSLRYSPEGVGLPIGNLTSQMFSNLYMNCFDQWVKRELGVKHYGRYVDDSYYIAEDKEWLKTIEDRVDNYLRMNLGIRLNRDKTRLTEVKKGVTFLGIHIKPFRRYVKTKSLQRMRQHVRNMQGVDEGSLKSKAVQERLLAQANSMLGVLNHTLSFRLRCGLFGSYPMFRIAYGTRGMKKFRLINRNSLPLGGRATIINIQTLLIYDRYGYEKKVS